MNFWGKGKMLSNKTFAILINHYTHKEGIISQSFLQFDLLQEPETFTFFTLMASTAMYCTNHSLFHPGTEL